MGVVSALLGGVVVVRVLQGHCVNVLAGLPVESVQCCVTSIPYWQLRAYGTPSQTWADGWVGEWGQEPSPEAYVAHTVEAFRAVRRALRNDGTLWLNIGDTYWNDPGGQHGGGISLASGQTGGKEKLRRLQTISDRAMEANKQVGRRKRGTHPVLKRKDLVGIPWRVAFALQADGWYLRSEIIWHKPNPLPESVTDRPTRSHESLFLLTKRGDYFYDADAIKEPQSEGTLLRFGQGKAPRKTTAKAISAQAISAQAGENRSNASFKNSTPESILEGGRNKRSVWTIPLAGFSEAHFATFPPALVEPCIKAGSRPGDTVLDPCGGSGTVGMVADRLARNAVLVELKGEYAEMARRRVVGDSPLFAEVTLEGAAG